MVKRILLLIMSASLFGILLTGCSYEPKNLSPKEREGYELYKVYCRQCHRLQKPKAHMAGDWPDTLDKMQRLMEEKSRKNSRIQIINNEQKAKILMFLESQTKKP